MKRVLKYVVLAVLAYTSLVYLVIHPLGLALWGKDSGDWQYPIAVQIVRMALVFFLALLVARSSERRPYEDALLACILALLALSGTDYAICRATLSDEFFYLSVMRSHTIVPFLACLASGGIGVWLGAGHAQRRRLHAE